MKHICLFLLACMTWFSCTEDPKTGTTATEQPPVTPVHEDGSIPLDVPGATTDGIFETISTLDSTSGQISKNLRPLNPISTAISENPIKKMDPVKPSYNPPKPMTPQESKVVNALVQDYWGVWGLVKIGAPATVSKKNQGAWFKFKPDGSYDYGHFEQKIGSGAWSFDGQKAMLLLDSELLGDDREWSLKLANTEDVMIWVGTGRFGTTNVQTKLQKYPAIPTGREELGLEKK